MLNDKHIIQYAEVLLEYLDNYKQLLNCPGLDEIFIEMYKKGYQDCLDDYYIKIRDTEETE